MMPSFRKKVTDFIRQISSGGNSALDGDLPPKSGGTFIHQYLNGSVSRQQPDVIWARSCEELPVKVASVMGDEVYAAYTGPDGGLTTVNRRKRHLDINDPDVQYIDSEQPSESSPSPHRPPTIIEDGDMGSPINQNGVEDSSTQNGMEVSDSTDAPSSPITQAISNNHAVLKQCENEEIAFITNWNRPHPRSYGLSTTLYECHPVTGEHAGSPIADSFGIVARENSALLCLADGVNWGEKASLAAKCAVHGCLEYLNRVFFGGPCRVNTTTDVFVALLQSFHAAHNLILHEGGLLTTLTAAVVIPYKGSSNSVVCVCNVGDSLAYVYSPKKGVREITQGSHDIYSNRDMRDALGALGPVDGQNPELNNLTCSMTVVEPEDIVFLTSDGISDNFDPVVGKFCIPKKQEDTQPKKIRQTTASGEEDEIFLPVVEAYQRHELTLLRLEDVLRNGMSSEEGTVSSAQQLCHQLVDFTKKLTMAKRRILEDPDLYTSGSKELGRVEQRNRRKKVHEKLAMVPGKLDHATVVAYEVGLYKKQPDLVEDVVQSQCNNITENNDRHSTNNHTTPPEAPVKYDEVNRRKSLLVETVV